MSWLALKKVTRMATRAVSPGFAAGLVSPNPTMAPANSTWATSSHPRRRPRKGGVKRSNRGDQKNLSVYGSPTRAISPISSRSTPSSFIQACKTVMVSSSGSPQLNPMSADTSIRRLNMILSNDFLLKHPPRRKRLAVRSRSMAKPYHIRSRYDEHERKNQIYIRGRAVVTTGLGERRDNHISQKYKDKMHSKQFF